MAKPSDNDYLTLLVPLAKDGQKTLKTQQLKRNNTLCITGDSAQSERLKTFIGKQLPQLPLLFISIRHTHQLEDLLTSIDANALAKSRGGLSLKDPGEITIDGPLKRILQQGGILVIDYDTVGSAIAEPLNGLFDRHPHFQGKPLKTDHLCIIGLLTKKGLEDGAFSEAFYSRFNQHLYIDSENFQTDSPLQTLLAASQPKKSDNRVDFMGDSAGDWKKLLIGSITMQQQGIGFTEGPLLNVKSPLLLDYPPEDNPGFRDYLNQVLCQGGGSEFGKSFKVSPDLLQVGKRVSSIDWDSLQQQLLQRTTGTLPSRYVPVNTQTHSQLARLQYLGQGAFAEKPGLLKLFSQKPLFITTALSKHQWYQLHTLLSDNKVSLLLSEAAWQSLALVGQRQLRQSKTDEDEKTDEPCAVPRQEVKPWVPYQDSNSKFSGPESFDPTKPAVFFSADTGLGDGLLKQCVKQLNMKMISYAVTRDRGPQAVLFTYQRQQNQQSNTLSSYQVVEGEICKALGDEYTIVILRDASLHPQLLSYLELALHTGQVLINGELREVKAQLWLLEHTDQQNHVLLQQAPQSYRLVDDDNDLALFYARLWKDFGNKMMPLGFDRVLDFIKLLRSLPSSHHYPAAPRANWRQLTALLRLATSSWKKEANVLDVYRAAVLVLLEPYRGAPDIYCELDALLRVTLLAAQSSDYTVVTRVLNDVLPRCRRVDLKDVRSQLLPALGPAILKRCLPRSLRLLDELDWNAIMPWLHAAVSAYAKVWGKDDNSQDKMAVWCRYYLGCRGFSMPPRQKSVKSNKGGNKQTVSTDDPVSLKLFNAKLSLWENQLERCVSVLLYHPLLFIQGLPGVGKSHCIPEIAKALANTDTSLGSTQCYGPLNIGPQTTLTDLTGLLSKWLDAPESKTQGKQYRLLIIDEANLASQALWNFLRGLADLEPAIWLEGKRHLLTPYHKVIFTGNPESFGGRQTGRVIGEIAVTVYFEPLADDYLGLLLTSFLGTTLIAETSHQQVIQRLLACRQALTLLNPQQQITLRDWQAVLFHYRVIASQHTQKVISLREDWLAAAVDYCLFAASGEQQALRYWYHCYLQRKLSVKQLFETPFIQPHNAGKLNKTTFDELVKKLQEQVCVTPNTSVYIQQLVTIMESRACRINHYKDLADTNLFGKLGYVIEGLSGLGKDFILELLLQAYGIAKRSPSEEQKNDSSAGGYYHLTASDLSSAAAIIQRARENSDIVIISEANLWPTAVLEGLLNMALTQPGKSSKSAGFLVIFTLNPASFEGRQFFSQALRNRFIYYYLGVYSQLELQSIVRFAYQKKTSKELNTKLLDQLFERHNKVTKQQGINPTLRDLLYIVDWLAENPAKSPNDKPWQQAFAYQLQQRYRIYSLFPEQTGASRRRPGVYPQLARLLSDGRIENIYTVNGESSEDYFAAPKQSIVLHTAKKQVDLLPLVLQCTVARHYPPAGFCSDQVYLQAWLQAWALIEDPSLFTRELDGGFGELIKACELLSESKGDDEEISSLIPSWSTMEPLKLYRNALVWCGSQGRGDRVLSTLAKVAEQLKNASAASVLLVVEQDIQVLWSLTDSLGSAPDIWRFFVVGLYCQCAQRQAGFMPVSVRRKINGVLLVGSGQRFNRWSVQSQTKLSDPAKQIVSNLLCLAPEQLLTQPWPARESLKSYGDIKKISWLSNYQSEALRLYMKIPVLRDSKPITKVDDSVIDSIAKYLNKGNNSNNKRSLDGMVKKIRALMALFTQSGDVAVDISTTVNVTRYDHANKILTIAFNVDTKVMVTDILIESSVIRFLRGYPDAPIIYQWLRYKLVINSLAIAFDRKVSHSRRTDFWNTEIFFNQTKTKHRSRGVDKPIELTDLYCMATVVKSKTKELPQQVLKRYLSLPEKIGMETIVEAWCFDCLSAREIKSCVEGKPGYVNVFCDSIEYLFRNIEENQFNSSIDYIGKGLTASTDTIKKAIKQITDRNIINWSDEGLRESKISKIEQEELYPDQTERTIGKVLEGKHKFFATEFYEMSGPRGDVKKPVKIQVPEFGDFIKAGRMIQYGAMKEEFCVLAPQGYWPYVKLKDKIETAKFKNNRFFFKIEEELKEFEYQLAPIKEVKPITLNKLSSGTQKLPREKLFDKGPMANKLLQLIGTFNKNSPNEDDLRKLEKWFCGTGVYSKTLETKKLWLTSDKHVLRAWLESGGRGVCRHTVASFIAVVEYLYPTLVVQYVAGHVAKNGVISSVRHAWVRILLNEKWVIFNPVSKQVDMETQQILRQRAPLMAEYLGIDQEEFYVEPESPLPVTRNSLYWPVPPLTVNPGYDMQHNQRVREIIRQVPELFLRGKSGMTVQYSRTGPGVFSVEYALRQLPAFAIMTMVEQAQPKVLILHLHPGEWQYINGALSCYTTFSRASLRKGHNNDIGAIAIANLWSQMLELGFKVYIATLSGLARVDNITQLRGIISSGGTSLLPEEELQEQLQQNAIEGKYIVMDYKALSAFYKKFIPAYGDCFWDVPKRRYRECKQAYPVVDSDNLKTAISQTTSLLKIKGDKDQKNIKTILEKYPITSVSLEYDHIPLYRDFLQGITAIYLNKLTNPKKINPQNYLPDNLSRLVLEDIYKGWLKRLFDNKLSYQVYSLWISGRIFQGLRLSKSLVSVSFSDTYCEDAKNVTVNMKPLRSTKHIFMGSPDYKRSNASLIIHVPKKIQNLEYFDYGDIPPILMQHKFLHTLAVSVKVFNWSISKVVLPQVRNLVVNCQQYDSRSSLDTEGKNQLLESFPFLQNITIIVQQPDEVRYSERYTIKRSLQRDTERSFFLCIWGA